MKPVSRLGVVLFEQALPLDFVGPTSILAYLHPNALKTRGLPADHALQVVYLGATTSPIQLVGGLVVTPNVSFSQVRAEDDYLDVILIPGGPGTRSSELSADAQEFVTWAAHRVEWTLSVCTGSLLLARTGVLCGKRATTNKAAFKEVQESATAGQGVEWVAHARWVEDGNVWTSSGVSAGMDMIVHWIERVFGKDIVQKAAAHAEYSATDRDNDPWARHHGLE